MNAGDRAGALEAVGAALAIDPNFLAAHALRDRIVAMVGVIPSSPAAATAAPADAVRPIASAEGYAQFEQRARRRRVDRRVDAARAAIASGRLRDAASAIDEIRDLDPNLPELRELTTALAVLGAPARSRHVGRWVAAAAAFGGVLLAASWVQETAGLGSRAMIARAPAVAPPSPSPVAIETPAIDEPTPAESAATSGELPLARLTLPEPPRPQLPAPAAAQTEAAVAPAAYAETPPVRVPGLLAPIDSPAVVPPPQAAAVPAAPASSPVSLASVSAAIPAAAPPSPAPVPVPVAPSDESLVQQTLQRYRGAYEGLDAQSARAVWPAVNQAALARAFDGLESQTLTFDACDVTLHGEAAAAVCRGTARYVTKVGSHEPRVEPRTWNFTLRKSGSAWTIESARAER
jgi:hypothetical protein